MPATGSCATRRRAVALRGDHSRTALAKRTTRAGFTVMRVLPSLLTVAVIAALLGMAGVDAWHSATDQGWLADGYPTLVRHAFWDRVDELAPIALGALALLLGLLALWRRDGALRRLRVPLVMVGLVVVARLLSIGVDLSGPKRPNVLLISIDTLRADRLGTYGYARPTSPVLDTRMAARGVVFEHAWSQSPKTTPSHMTMLTSLYPTVHGVPLWEGEGAAPTLSPRVHTLAEILQNAGYTTAAYTAGAHMHRDRGFDQGFEEYKHGSQLKRAVAFIERPHLSPFFLFFHTYEVHDPYLPPHEETEEFVGDPVPAITEAVAAVRAGIVDWPKAHGRFWAPVDATDKRHVRHVSDLYDAGIRHMDATTLAALLDALDRRKLADDTLVVFTSDHGEAFTEHGHFLHEDLFPETLHVPLVMRLPGQLPAGRRIGDLAGLVDLVPTVLDLLGLPIPSQAQGQSLAALAIGKPEGHGRRTVMAEYSHAGHRFESARSADATVIRNGDGLAAFDRRADPGEERPLPPGDSLGPLQALLDDWHRENVTLAGRFGPRNGIDLAAPSADTVDQLRALGYVE